MMIKLNRLTSTLILGLGLLGFALSASAGPPEGKGKGGGKAEETTAIAELSNFDFDSCDDNCYALSGDEVVAGEGNTSLYEDATLPDSTDCALVLATRIDKQSGVAFLRAPDPRGGDNCDPTPNRWFQIWQDPLLINFNEDPMLSNPEVVLGRIDLGGLYRPVVDAERDGATVSIAIGPYRIAYESAAIDVDDGDPDVRTVTVDDTEASICKWGKGGKSGKKDVCIDLGGINLPFTVKFTRIPPQ